MATQRVRVLRELWAIILKSRDNQFVQLAVVGAAGSVVYKGQQLLRMLWTRVLNNFRCQVRLQNREREIYDAVIAFIARQKMIQSTVLLAEKKRLRREEKARKAAPDDLQERINKALSESCKDIEQITKVLDDAKTAQHVHPSVLSLQKKLVLTKR